MTKLRSEISMSVEANEERIRHTRIKRKLRFWGSVLVLFLLVVGMAWFYLFREVQTQYAAIEEHFKYASIGTEQKEGIPYWIWLVLPRVFSDHLPAPGGYTSFGFVWEAGRETPIGFAKKTIGFPRIGVNCSLCHTATWRKRSDDSPEILLGGPSHHVDIQSYQTFLFRTAGDPRFTADIILPAIDALTDLSLPDKLLYRYVLIPQTKKALLKQKKQFDFFSKNPRQGHGRIDPFNPVKYRILEMTEDGTIGTSDMQSIWNQKGRAHQALHWDGMNPNLREVVLSSAIGDGATETSIVLEDLTRLESWISDLPAPKYPLPINRALAERGSTIFHTHCGSCHAVGSPRLGTVIPLSEIETDRHRSAMWRQNSADRYNAYIKNASWKFQNFRATEGYVAVPLDGIWARAPYLHNGSVPSLQDLLQKVEKRPAVFWRGNDVYDFEKLGFTSDVPKIEQAGFLYVTTEKGNANTGHRYGTDLSEDDKRALLEYLKTL
jgi:mono/diheme cytochrome c family protein